MQIMRQVMISKWSVISAIAGVAIYYPEWIELFAPGCCTQWPDKVILRMYVSPILLAAILGLVCMRRPFECWALLMIPSWIVRLTMLLEGGGNLWPPVVLVDCAHLLCTGLVFWGAYALAKRSRHPSKV